MRRDVAAVAALDVAASDMRAALLGSGVTQGSAASDLSFESRSRVTKVVPSHSKSVLAFAPSGDPGHTKSRLTRVTQCVTQVRGWCLLMEDTAVMTSEPFFPKMRKAGWPCPRLEPRRFLSHIQNIKSHHRMFHIEINRKHPR